MKRILAIETATNACSCALWCEGEIHERFEIAPRRHAELILPMIDAVLKEAKLNVADLDAIAFGQGPGTFMGVRLAASVAMGLAFGADIPIIPVSTLQTLAQGVYQQTGSRHVAAAWDARMGEMYWGCYSEKDGIMQPVVDDALSAPAAVQLPVDREWTLAGNAWEIYKKQFVISVQNKTEYPRAEYIYSFLAQKGQIVQVSDFSLVYLRKQVAHH